MSLLDHFGMALSFVAGLVFLWVISNMRGVTPGFETLRIVWYYIGYGALCLGVILWAWLTYDAWRKDRQLRRRMSKI